MSTTNILIIEDNAADIALIEAYLKDAGLQHTLSKSGSLNEGLDFLKENRVSLVLLDLKLAGTEGFRTLQLFREKAPDTPVIVLAGFKNEVMGIQWVKAGAQDFLVKGDFDSRILARTIRYSLHRFETQMKLQEKAKELSHSERRNQLAHQIARFGKWEMDIVNNAMRWDEEIFRFFGFHPFSFEPTLSDYIKYVHVEDREKVEAFFEAAIKDGLPHHIEHRAVIKNTNLRYLQAKAQVNYDEQTNRILLVGGVQDITEMKLGRGLEGQAAQSTNSPGTQIEEDMLSEFNFNVRTPIASMVNFIYLLENSPVSEQQKDFIEGLKSSLDDLSFALNNWINLSILKEDKVEAKNTGLVLEDVFQLLKSELPIQIPEAGKKPVPENPEGPVSILLVEDHDLHRLATKRMLAGWSSQVDVDVAQNGREAYEKVLKKDYDIILMDLHMPVLDGIEATIKIRNKTNVPIIALTANESKQEQQRCAMVGMNDYIVKPVRPRSLFSGIMRQLYANR